MDRNQTFGALIAAACLIIAVAFIVLLFFYDPYIASIIDLGSWANVRFWLIATPVELGFVVLMAICTWIGYTMLTATTKHTEEVITTETTNISHQ
jgi:hypothetical protein